MAQEPATESSKPVEIEKKNLIYTSCYCEENVFKFCEKLNELNIDLSNYFAVFISNQEKAIPVWCSQQSKGGMTIWDYHVILLYINRSNDNKLSRFYDFDSNLPFPCEMIKYFESTFKPSAEIQNDFRQEFRIVSAKNYLKTFYSDRSHMYDKKSKKWNMPPPKYDCIMQNNPNNSKKDGSNLMSHFVDVNNLEIGKVFTIKEFHKWLIDGSGTPKQKQKLNEQKSSK